MEFVDAIVGGSIPRQFIPAVEKGVRQAMQTGIQASFPVVDCKVTVYDGSYHDVDSSEAAFIMAGIIGFNSVSAKASPVLLEPILNLEVTIPENMLGAVMTDLTGKRGRVVGTENAGAGKTRLKATVPHAEMLRYAIDLRSLTRGHGTFTITPSHYEEVPRICPRPSSPPTRRNTRRNTKRSCSVVLPNRVTMPSVTARLSSAGVAAARRRPIKRDWAHRVLCAQSTSIVCWNAL